MGGAGALRCARAGDDHSVHLVELHRVGYEGGSAHRGAWASLVADRVDPMVVIRWKDIFESLEAAVDACETVAHGLEGITPKQRRPRI